MQLDDDWLIKARDRYPFVFLGRGQVKVSDGAFVIVQESDRIQVPVGKLNCIFLEPGVNITHDAVKIAGESGTLLLWTGESGVRFYAAAHPAGDRPDKIKKQARLALNKEKRNAVARRMFSHRFDEEVEQETEIEALRGREGQRVKRLYKHLANQHGVSWSGRKYDPDNFQQGDRINRCLSAATTCLYGISESVIVLLGYDPSLGFIHRGNERSFVFDIADLYKFSVAFPIAFRIASDDQPNPVRRVRHDCADAFKENGLVEDIIQDIEQLFEGL